MEVKFKFLGCVSNPVLSYVNIYTSGASSGETSGLLVVQSWRRRLLKERCLVVLGEDQEEIELLVGEMSGGSLLCS